MIEKLKHIKGKNYRMSGPMLRPDLLHAHIIGRYPEINQLSYEAVFEDGRRVLVHCNLDDTKPNNVRLTFHDGVLKTAQVKQDDGSWK